MYVFIYVTKGGREFMLLDRCQGQVTLPAAIERCESRNSAVSRAYE